MLYSEAYENTGALLDGATITQILASISLLLTAKIMALAFVPWLFADTKIAIRFIEQLYKIR